MARKSLRDRNQAAYEPATPAPSTPAIEADQPTAPAPAAPAIPSADSTTAAPAIEADEPSAPVTSITEAASKKAATKKAPAKKTTAKKAPAKKTAATNRATRTGSVTTVERPDGTVAHKISIHIPKDVWEDSRRAYCADLLDERPGRPTSHSEWVEDAVMTHADRDPAERKTLEGALPEPQLSGTPRPVYLADDAIDAITDELARDRKAGLWRARSAFIVQAIHVAVEIARDRRGGELPEAPKRLPRQAVKTARRAIR